MLALVAPIRYDTQGSNACQKQIHPAVEKVESTRLNESVAHIFMQNRRKHMPIAISFAPSRSKRIAVDVVPAKWQLYIAQ